MGRSKYGNRKTVALGKVFHSKREAERYQDLVALHLAGQIYGLELQPRFKMPCGITYVADFKYYDSPDGNPIIEDVKGFQTPVFKLKMKLMKYFFPEIKIILS